uniref:Uncharacterized protein n=1 Tax=Arundo donax TaxID=35708 RepID=A0A0A9B098_ARUDO
MKSLWLSQDHQHLLPHESTLHKELKMKSAYDSTSKVTFAMVVKGRH